MHGIFDSLTRAYLLTLDSQRFNDPETPARIAAALKDLKTSSDALRAHGMGQNKSLDYLSQSLARDARDTLDMYEMGGEEDVRLMLGRLTANCFACHSRVPSEEGFNLGQEFVNNPAIKSLPLSEQVRLQVVARQFDDALATYRKILGRAPSGSATGVYFSGAFEGFLKISIQVKNDYDGAIEVLEAFLATHPDVPRFLEANISHWISALRALSSGQEETSPLIQARDLITQARAMQLFAADRRGLVHYIAATGLLHQYLDSNPPEAMLPETYYLLGMAESNISRLSWLSEAGFFLESAIRTNPHSPYAQQAFDFLEANTLSRYTGSSGMNLPQAISEYLDELRDLISEESMGAES